MINNVYTKQLILSFNFRLWKVQNGGSKGSKREGDIWEEFKKTEGMILGKNSGTVGSDISFQNSSEDLCLL